MEDKNSNVGAETLNFQSSPELATGEQAMTSGATTQSGLGTNLQDDEESTGGHVDQLMRCTMEEKHETDATSESIPNIDSAPDPQICVESPRIDERSRRRQLVAAAAGKRLARSQKSK